MSVVNEDANGGCLRSVIVIDTVSAPKRRQRERDTAVAPQLFGYERTPSVVSALNVRTL